MGTETTTQGDAVEATLADEPTIEETEAATAHETAEEWADPAVIGLMGFATTTMVTGLHHAGIFASGPTLALALAFGGTAQVMAGLIAMRKGELFPGSAFTSYGAFWWSIFTMLFLLPAGGVEVTAIQEAGFFFVWTLFTLMFCLAVPAHGKFLTALFYILLVAFAWLTIFTYGLGAGWFPGGGIVQTAMGWEIFVVGLLAWYIAGADLVNADRDGEPLPIA